MSKHGLAERLHGLARELRAPDPDCERVATLLDAEAEFLALEDAGAFTQLPVAAPADAYPSSAEVPHATR